MWFAKNKQRKDQDNNSINSSINDLEVLETLRAVENNHKLAQEATINQTIKRDVNRRTPLFQPTAYSTIKPIVDELIAYKTILVDFSKLPEADKKRTIDFLTGVMYGLDGEYTKLENKVYKFIVRK